jgi:hypothetical protein
MALYTICGFRWGEIMMHFKMKDLTIPAPLFRRLLAIIVFALL